MSHPKRFFLLLAATVFLCGSFWLLSRYPELSQKSDASGAVQIEEQLSHRAVISVDSGAGMVEKIAVTFINWAYANKRGMAFGVLLASCFLTLLGYMPTAGSKNRFWDSVYGMLVGTPLGVCVNCVAPITKAVYEGGKSLQTALALMFSSPGLNIVVLTMVFTLFPFYVAMIKLSATLFLILCIVPFMSEKKSPAVSSEKNYPYVAETLVGAVWGVVKDFATSFVYIALRTVPLMLLAGILGAAVVHGWHVWGVEFDNEFSLFSLIVASIFGTFLPLPIAVDVLVAQSLLAANVNISLVATLLFTLGIFSIYSFLIVWRMSSLWLACKVYIIVVVVGVFVGWGSSVYSEYSHNRWMNYYDAYMKNSSTVIEAENIIVRYDAQDLKNAIGASNEVRWSKVDSDSAQIMQLTHVKRNREKSKLFDPLAVSTLGIYYKNSLDIKNYIEAFYHGKGVATGDYNNDGYLDIVLATNNGVVLYVNNGTRGFEEYPLNIAELSGEEAFVVALVDADNDGWLDIYVSTFGKSNYLVYNMLVDGDREVRTFDNGGALVTLSAGFADVNGDGYLDILQGNWTQGEYPGKEARNQLMLSDGTLGYGTTYLNENFGLTLSALFSDVNRDGDPDLFIGNDWIVPDNYYLGQGSGVFVKSNKIDNVFPLTAYNTMNIDSSDYDNDGDFDLYLAGIGGDLAPQEARRFGGNSNDAYCLRQVGNDARSKCFLHGVLSDAVFLGAECSGVKPLANEEAVKDCLVAKMLYLATSEKNSELCKKIPSGYDNQRLMCDSMFSVDVERTLLDDSNDLPQLKNANVLLQQNGDGVFGDVAKAAGVNFGGWAWNAKFADLDNDGWQDLYVVNGSPMTNLIRFSNYFFKNGGEKSFSLSDVGLESYAHSSAYSYFDYDNDGDLDILVNTTDGEYLFYENGSQVNAVTFELEQVRGNKQCIGCVIKITTADGITQMREIKKSGGYLSFDSSRVHFGVGQHTEIKKMSVRWNDGTELLFEATLAANSHYKIIQQ
jgi:uncharacterized membrane protein YraQ (UPF0718 family)